MKGEMLPTKMGLKLMLFAHQEAFFVCCELCPTNIVTARPGLDPINQRGVDVVRSRFRNASGGWGAVLWDPLSRRDIVTLL